MGRDAELAAISQRVAAAADGRSGVAWVDGDAGFGKTALVRRVIATLPPEFVVLSAEADEIAREEPFGVAAQLCVTTSTSSLAAGLER